jgi:pimeloyl-ACP methyl ester carboxylesterase
LIHAYAELRRRVGLEASIFLLGFSLGSGVAAHGASTLEPPIAGLFLCEAFTSFREAAAASGLPYWLAHAVPDVWNTVAVIRQIHVPLYLVHSDADRLFPLDMPKRIIEAHGQGGELIVVPGLSHNEAFLRPTNVYWQPIVEHILRA